MSQEHRPFTRPEKRVSRMLRREVWEVVHATSTGYLDLVGKLYARDTTALSRTAKKYYLSLAAQAAELWLYAEWCVCGKAPVVTITTWPWVNRAERFFTQSVYRHAYATLAATNPANN